MPIQSPAKDPRKTSAGALFGQGREKVSAQPTERPSQGLCSDRGAKWAQHSPPKDLEKPFKGRCAVADPVSRYSGASGQKTRGAPVIRMLPLFGKRTPARDRKGARGSVRAMPEHSTCRVIASSLLTSTTSHLRETETHRLRASVSAYADTPPVTDEHHTNCNTRSPRRFRSCRNRGLPCGNQSEPAESRRRALSDNRSPCPPWPAPCRVPWRR